MTDKLLPCPFCGSEFVQVRYMGGKWQEPSAFESGFRGECCDCYLITAAYSTEAEAAAAWNTRANAEQDALPMTEEIMRAHGWVRERTCRIVLPSLAGWWHCSACGEQVHTYGRDGLFERPNFCPNCGAKVVN